MNSSIAMRRNNSRSRRAKRNILKFFVSLVIIVVVVTIVVLCSNNTAQASESLSLNKYYKTVSINYGDTLWEIASEYTDGSNSRIKECISEIMSINNLKSDNITAGMKIIVPYYAE